MAVPSLTQDEARRRAELLSVRRYDIEVDLTGLAEGTELRCTSVVSFACREPGASTFVDCASDVVDAVLNGTPLPPARDGRIELPGLAAENTLRVVSVRPDASTGEGVHRAVDPADGEVYVWTSFEPDEARHVWACFDQPDLKAPHGFTVLAPATWTVTSNTGEAQVDDLGGTRRWTFVDTPPLSTYNAVVNAGPFHEVRAQAGGYDLGLYARRSLAGVLDRDAAEIFTVTDQGLAFYGRVFGLPFPQRVYNQVFMPEFGGAMENYGCVTWSDAYLRRVEPTGAEWELFAKVLLHEMAHMWFGNIVTMRWWDDLWLNEAFAEFACNWAAVRATKYTDSWAGHLAEDKLRAYLADQGPASHPIRQPIRDVAQAASIFDDITYPKGASVLAQLMTYVGEDEFSAGMTDYFTRHRWGNTTLKDLMDALAAASGRDLDTWRRGWLETAGTDVLRLDRANGRVEASAPQGDPRPHVLAVGAYARATTPGGRATRVAAVPVEITGTVTPVQLPDADFYLVNDDDLTFAACRPDPADLEQLVAAAGTLPTAISRGVAVATVWDLLVAGESGASEVFGVLDAVLAVETAASVVEPYLARAVELVEFWAPDSTRPELADRLAERCWTLVAAAGSRRPALRALAQVARDGEELDRLRERAGDDIDLQWRALVRASELGDDTAAAGADLVARDPDPDAWVRELTVRAAAPDAAVKDEVWTTVVVDRAVPVQSVGRVMAAFWRPGQDELAAPFAPRYLDLLPGLHHGGMIPAMVYAFRLFPPFGIDADYLRSAQTAAAEAAPVVGKTVIERADEFARMLRARSR